jgi:hypothetical protein
MYRQRLTVFSIACALTVVLCACGGMAGTPPAITVQPQDQSVAVGSSATFSVTATGSNPLTYQWMKNGASISGATSASYTTPPTVLTDEHSSFAVVVSNNSGSVTSNSAILSVVATP